MQQLLMRVPVYTHVVVVVACADVLLDALVPVLLERCEKILLNDLLNIGTFLYVDLQDESKSESEGDGRG